MGVKVRCEIGPKEALAGTCILAIANKPGEVANKSSVHVQKQLTARVLAALKAAGITVEPLAGNAQGKDTEVSPLLVQSGSGDGSGVEAQGVAEATLHTGVGGASGEDGDGKKNTKVKNLKQASDAQQHGVTDGSGEQNDDEQQQQETAGGTAAIGVKQAAHKKKKQHKHEEELVAGVERHYTELQQQEQDQQPHKPHKKKGKKTSPAEVVVQDRVADEQQAHQQVQHEDDTMPSMQHEAHNKQQQQDMQQQASAMHQAASVAHEPSSSKGQQPYVSGDALDDEFDIQVEAEEGKLAGTKSKVGGGKWAKMKERKMRQKVKSGADTDAHALQKHGSASNGAGSAKKKPKVVVF